jgi:hypothetical protein
MDPRRDFQIGTWVRSTPELLGPFHESLVAYGPILGPCPDTIYSVLVDALFRLDGVFVASAFAPRELESFVPTEEEVARWLEAKLTG